MPGVPHEYHLFSLTRPATMEDLSIIRPGPPTGDSAEPPSPYYLFVVYEVSEWDAKVVAALETWAPTGYDTGVRHIINPSLSVYERAPWALPWKFNPDARHQPYSAS